VAAVGDSPYGVFLGVVACKSVTCPRCIQRSLLTRLLHKTTLPVSLSLSFGDGLGVGENTYLSYFHRLSSKAEHVVLTASRPSQFSRDKSGLPS